MTTMIPTPVHDRLYIGGQWTAASGSETIPVENPYTEQVIANIPVGDASDVNRAVTAARDAFPGWAATPIADRVDLIDATFTPLLTNAAPPIPPMPDAPPPVVPLPPPTPPSA